MGPLYRLGDIYPTDAINKALRSIWKFNWTNDVKAQSEAHLPERYYAHAGDYSYVHGLTVSIRVKME